MSYNKTLYFVIIIFFRGGGGERGMKNENEIKDENENKATYFYAQGRNNSTPKVILGSGWGARDRSPFLAKAAQLM